MVFRIVFERRLSGRVSGERETLKEKLQKRNSLEKRKSPNEQLSLEREMLFERETIRQRIVDKISRNACSECNGKNKRSIKCSKQCFKSSKFKHEVSSSFKLPAD